MRGKITKLYWELVGLAIIGLLLSIALSPTKAIPQPLPDDSYQIHGGEPHGNA
jgi:energy-converting hydrogenase Eha subunit F